MAVAAVFAIWRLQEVIPGVGSLKLPLVTLVVAIISFLAARPFGDLSRLFQETSVKWVVVMAILAILEAPFALVRTDAVIFLLYDFAPTLLLCVFLAASVRSTRDVRAVMGAICLGGVMFCLYSRTHSYIDSSGRPAGIVYYDANDLALNAATTAALCLGMLHAGRSVMGRLFWSTVLGVLLVTVLWTASRGAFVALVVMAAYLLFSPIMPAARRGSLVVAAFLVIAVAGGPRYVAIISTMFNPSADYNFSGDSPNGRGEVWKRGLTYVYDRPVMGAGVRNYTVADGRSAYAMEMQAAGRGSKWSRAHNSFLEIAVEMGVPGFIAFLAIIFGAFGRAHSLSRRGGTVSTEVSRLMAYLAAALATYAVGGFFLSAEYWPLLYVLVGLIIALDVRMTSRARPKGARGRTSLGQGQRVVLQPNALPVHAGAAVGTRQSI